jgi:hypothetical protein
MEVLLASVIQIKRGTAAQVAAVTPVAGEPVYKTDTKKLVIGDGSTAGGTGDIIEAQSRVFMINGFTYPAPGTDWTPQLAGAGLAASLATKKCWIPLNFLKVGDVITAYSLVGDATEATALTLDCKLVRVNKADPLTTTDITNGAIVQVTADGNFDVVANPDDETVATDKQYVLEILGTTGAGDSIVITGAEVTITRR